MGVARSAVTVVALVCAATAASPATGTAALVPIGGTLDLAHADTVFTVPGQLGAPAASEVAFAGDMNGDGVGDQAIALPLDTGAGRARAGRIHVVFGQPGPSVELVAPDHGG